MNEQLLFLFRFGTVAAYYCTSSRHRLAGNPKLRCLADGSWDADPPMCRISASKTTPDEEDEQGGEEIKRPKLKSRPGFPRIRPVVQARDPLGEIEEMTLHTMKYRSTIPIVSATDEQM